MYCVRAFLRPLLLAWHCVLLYVMISPAPVVIPILHVIPHVSKMSLSLLYLSRSPACKNGGLAFCEPLLRTRCTGPSYACADNSIMLLLL